MNKQDFLIFMQDHVFIFMLQWNMTQTCCLCIPTHCCVNVSEQNMFHKRTRGYSTLNLLRVVLWICPTIQTRGWKTGRPHGSLLKHSQSAQFLRFHITFTFLSMAHTHTLRNSIIASTHPHTLHPVKIKPLHDFCSKSPSLSDKERSHAL